MDYLGTLKILKDVGMIRDFHLGHVEHGWYLRIEGIAGNPPGNDGLNHVDSDLIECLDYAIKHTLRGVINKLPPK